VLCCHFPYGDQLPLTYRCAPLVVTRKQKGNLLGSDFNKYNEYILSNHIISRRSSYIAPCRAALSPQYHPPQRKAKIMPGGLSFYKEQEHFPPTYPKERKPRNNIEGFSKASQRNFRDTLMRLDLKPFFCGDKSEIENNGFFITLNWPEQHNLNKFTIARDLEKFSKKLRSDYEGSFLGAIWKKELQRKGTPHIHIVVLFIECY